MDLSHFLAKLLGLSFLLMGVLWIARGQVIMTSVEEFLSCRPAVFLSGVVALFAGVAMVIGHNVWELNWRGLITLLGCAAAAKGIGLMAFPDWPRKPVDWLRNDWFARAWLLVGLVIGGYLTWAGFFAL
jgi:uncharacterized membrane protein